MANLSTLTITWDDQDRPVITVQYEQNEDGASEATPDEWLGALVERLADKSANYLRALIDVNASQGSISLVDLASHLGVEKKEVDGWNRNLGRSIKAVVRDYGFLRREEGGGTAPLFDFEWHKGGNVWL